MVGHADRACRDPDHRRRPGRAGDEPMLGQRGRPHLVLERHRIAERWRTERWDGLRFQFPNWSVQLPDFSVPARDPDGFASEPGDRRFPRRLRRLRRARRSAAASRSRHCGGSTATACVAETSTGPIEAGNVVVATGPYQRAVMPDLLAEDARPLPGPCQPLPRARAASGRCVLVGGLGAHRAPRSPRSWRGPAGASTSRSASHRRHAASLSRARSDLVAGGDGPRPGPVEKARAPASLPRSPARMAGIPSISATSPNRASRCSADRRRARWRADLRRRPGRRAWHRSRCRLRGLPRPGRRHGSPVSATMRRRIRRRAPRRLPCRTRSSRCEARSAGAGIGSVIWSTGYGFDLGWIDVPVLDQRARPCTGTA